MIIVQPISTYLLVVFKSLRTILEHFHGIMFYLFYFPQVSADMANPEADMDKLMVRMEQLQNALDATNGWELERQLEVCRHLVSKPAKLSGFLLSSECCYSGGFRKITNVNFVFLVKRMLISRIVIDCHILV